MWKVRTCLSTINLLREALSSVPVPDFSPSLLLEVLPSEIRGLPCRRISFGGCDLQIELIRVSSVSIDSQAESAPKVHHQEYWTPGPLLDFHGEGYPREMADCMVTHRIRVPILALG
jgi:hypothetical protein